MMSLRDLLEQMRPGRAPAPRLGRLYVPDLDSRTLQRLQEEMRHHLEQRLREEARASSHAFASPGEWNDHLVTFERKLREQMDAEIARMLGIPSLGQVADIIEFGEQTEIETEALLQGADYYRRRT